MGDFHNNWYSDIIVYDERKKYFYLWARKNRPLLDDEVRAFNLSVVDQLRRSMQHVYGHAGSPTETYSNSIMMGANTAFKIKQATSPSNTDFLIQGGDGLENPGVLFINGFYVFLNGSIHYSEQNDLGSLTDDGYTETAIPDLTDPSGGQERVDVVYVDLHFAEASAVTGADASEYTDENLKNPIVGTETASRARAVFDIRVWEDYRFKNLDGTARTITQIQNLKISGDVFTSLDFLGTLEADLIQDTNPVNHHYRVPVAVIYRRGSQNITDADIIDLLDLYDKRILTLNELTYRINHGGFTSRDVTELNLNSSEAGYSGLFQPRFNHAKLDEGAYATGANEGLGSEAFNTNSVTPRVLDTYGKFAMGSLLVGGATGVVTGAVDSVTGPVALGHGELVAEDVSANTLYVGYDVGITGVREYRDKINVHMQGITGDAGLRVINRTGETGTFVEVFQTPGLNTYVDYQGRHGIGTDRPGWSGPNPVFNVGQYPETVSIGLDVNTSARVTKHLFVDKNTHLAGDLVGQSYKIPSVMGSGTPAILGVTGIPIVGVTASPASIQVVPGIAVVGITGSIQGYTGGYGFYEAYDHTNSRIFTIGSLGDNFDRQVLSLFGTSQRDLFISDGDLMNLPGGGSLSQGDIVSYVISLAEGGYVTGSVTVSTTGVAGLQEVADDINDPLGGGFTRGMTYSYYEPQEYGATEAPTVTTETGTAVGAMASWEGETGAASNNYLHLVLKSMPEIDKSVTDMTLYLYDTELGVTYPITSTKSAYYGSGEYGGDLIDLSFIKFDLGTVADGWLFNGDVYFNGNGLLSRVTFSPDVVFRDDVFCYGKLYAERLMIQQGDMVDLSVERYFGVEGLASIVEGLAVGYGPYESNGFNEIKSIQASTVYEDFVLKQIVNGGIRSNNIVFFKGTDPRYFDNGAIWEMEHSATAMRVWAVINGAYDDVNFPYGIHLIDSRAGLTDEERFRELVIDGHDYHGDPPAPYAVKLWVKGDIEVGATESGSLIGGGVLTRRLTCGLNATEVDDQYTFSLKSGEAYIENLTVKSLQYDASNQGAEALVFEPQNIVVVKTGELEATHNKNTGILRTKQFSLDTMTKSPVYLENTNSLNGTHPVNEGPEYQEYTETHGYRARWSIDTCSLSRACIEAFSASRGDDTVTSTRDFNSGTLIGGYDNQVAIAQWMYSRNYFSRIIIGKLGTLKIVWTGYSIDKVNPDPYGSDIDWTLPANMYLVSDINLFSLEKYEFTSYLLKSTADGSTVFNWLNPTNNLIAQIRASLIDKPVSGVGGTFANLIYEIVGNIGVFIPVTAWEGVELKKVPGTAGTSDVYERHIYTRWGAAIAKFNLLDFVRQNQLSDFPLPPTYTPGEWQVALHPKLSQQRFYNLVGQLSSENSQNKRYEGLWDIDLVIYPTNNASCNNLVGSFNLSYM